LPDGTGLNLDSDSSVVIRFNRHERVVEIVHGQALFEVTHQTARRYRVIAGDPGVIAVGTEFDVMRRSASTRVTVVEGTVAVFTGEAPLVTVRAMLTPQALSLSAGEQVQINDHDRLPNPSKVNVQLALAWMRREIAFDEEPLGEVAEEFNHYSAVPIVVQSEKLRAVPISGVFNAYDTDSLVEFVAA
jgi:transmembrane sensor